MKEYIITNKNVITRRIIKEWQPEFVHWKWKGTSIIGIQQLISLITEEAKQRIYKKYFQEEIKNIMKEIKLKKLTPKELKEIFKFIKFKETNLRGCDEHN